MTNYTVSGITTYIKNLLTSDIFLSNVYVEGEVCSFRSPSKSGHLYFELKDDRARIQCVFYHIMKKFDKIPFKEGDHVKVEGSIDLYDRSGQYQFRVRNVEVEGLGSLYQKFLETKEKLEKEGLFNKCNRPLPKFPEKIGILTSETGAALQDVLSVLNRRYPRIKLVLYPTRVQGVTAIKDVIDGLDYFYNYEDLDLILITRGGGSYDELSIFNDEHMARKIVESKVPVVSAIGHETDFMISDFAADLRASTPTAAAAIITPNLVDLIADLEKYRYSFIHQIENKISYNRQTIDRLLTSLENRNPIEKLKREKENLRTLRESLIYSIRFKVEKEKRLLEKKKSEFIIHDHKKILSKGFSLTFDSNNKIITAKKQVKDGDIITTHLLDGKIKSVVRED